MLDLSLDLLVEKHISLMQERSQRMRIKPSNQGKVYFKNGPITHDGWFGFMMTSEFQNSWQAIGEADQDVSQFNQ